MTHLARIKAMPCVLCETLGQTQRSTTDAHHIRTGQGGAQRAADELAIPLCHEQCHQGPTGIHGNRSLLKIAKVTELDLLALTIANLMDYGQRTPRPRILSTKIVPRRVA